MTSVSTVVTSTAVHSTRNQKLITNGVRTVRVLEASTKNQKGKQKLNLSKSPSVGLLVIIKSWFLIKVPFNLW